MDAVSQLPLTNLAVVVEFQLSAGFKSVGFHITIGSKPISFAGAAHGEFPARQTAVASDPWFSIRKFALRFLNQAFHLPFLGYSVFSPKGRVLAQLPQEFFSVHNQTWMAPRSRTAWI